MSIDGKNLVEIILDSDVPPFRRFHFVLTDKEFKRVKKSYAASNLFSIFDKFCFQSFKGEIVPFRGNEIVGIIFVRSYKK